jgi:hypothetical protein
LRQDALQQSSATRIQSAVRNHRATNEMIRRAQGKLQKPQDQNLKASQISQKTLDDAMKEIIKEDEASTTISSALRGHKGRKKHNIIKNYPQQALKRQLELSNTQPSTKLQSVPRTSYLQNVNTKKSNIKDKYNKALSEHTVLKTDLQPKPLIRQAEAAATKISKVIRGHKVRKQLPEIIEEYDRQQLINKVNEIEQRANKMNDAAIKIQSAARNRKALKELYRREDRRDQYKNLINSGEIQEAFNRRENRRIKATTIQSSIRNKRARNEIEAASHNFNPEGYQELLRKNLKASQSQISHIDTRSNLPQSSKDKIIKQANERISRIDNLITKKSKAGRTRTRSGTTTEEPVATRTGRLSMLSTTSTQAAMTPKKK